MRLKNYVVVGLLGFWIVGCSKVQQLAETVSLEQLSIVTSSLSPGVISDYYSDNLTASGGSYPYSFSVISGSLPSGLSLSSGGEVSGTPTALGTSSFTVQVTDAKGATSTADFSISVTSSLNITTSSLATATTGVPYAQAIAVTGGSGTYSFSASGLPSGFSISTSTGIISGSSGSSSTNTVTVTVVDSNGLQDSETYTLAVAAAPVITAASLDVAAAGAAYSATLAVTGGVSPFTWTVNSGSLPSGLSLSSAGVISGTPDYGDNLADSPFAFIVQVEDSLGQTDLQSFSLTVSLAPKIVDDFRQPLRPGKNGVYFLDYLTVEGGVGAKSFSATGLPTGLSINATSGYISGTVTGAAGSYNVDFTVQDSYGLSSTKTKKIIVSSAAYTDIRYSAPIQTPVGYTGSGFANPNGIDVEDLNADGINDVVWSAQDSRGIIVMLGDGTGNFTKYFYASPGSVRPRFIKIADMNGDAIPDVVTGTITGDNRIEVYLGNAAGWTSAPVTKTFNVALENYGFDIGDMNGDGKNDIVFTSWAGNIRVLYNCTTSATVTINGSGVACNLSNSPLTMHHVSIDALSQPRDLVVHDFDGDGKLDIVATSYNGAAVGIILGNGNGTYGTIYTALTGASGPRGIAKADMDGDGRMDVVVTGDNAISVMLNTAGTAPQRVTLTATAFAINDLGVNSEYIDVADMNGDGFPDVAFSSAGTYYNSLGTFLNDGSGGLTSRTVMSMGYQTVDVRLKPILSASSALSRPDIVTAVGQWVNVARLQVLPNSGSTTVPFDFGQYNYSGQPATAMASYGAAQTGDINEDGYNDIMFKVGGAANMLLGNSSGTFTLSSDSYPTGDVSANWWQSRQLLLVDLNGDGHLDMVSGNWNNGGLGTVTTLLGNGDGTFGTQSSFSITQTGCTANLGVRSIDAADFNRDGKMDLVVAVGCTSTTMPRAYVYFGNADGTFNTATRNGDIIGDNQTVLLVAAVDVNKDGAIDVVTVSNTSVIEQYINDGNGSFSLYGTNDFTMSGLNLSNLLVGDLDGNGYLDYVITAQNSATIGRILSTSTGTVTAGSTITFNGAVGGYLSQPQAGAVMLDYNRDGYLDFITLRRFQDINPTNRNGGGGLHFYKNNGSGTFTAQSRVLTPAAPGPYMEGLLTAADLNGDGVLDLINTNAYTSSSSGIGVNMCTSY